MRGRVTTTWAAVVLAAASAGCTSAPPPAGGGGGPGQGQGAPQGGAAAAPDAPAPEVDPTIEVKVDLEWDDIDTDEQGRKNAEDVARWVSQRRNAVQTCLNHRPQALTQAVRLLEGILERVPDSSKDRLLLAQCYFVDAVYWWRLTDVTAWEMNRIRADRTEHQSRGGGPMTDAQVQARLAELQPALDSSLAQLNVSGKRALSAFLAYRQARPDEKQVYDYLWKLYFFLQEFREAKRWLELVIHEMDEADVPRQEPLRQDYEALVEEMKDKIVDERMGTYQPVRPQERDRLSGGGGSPSPPGGR